MGMKLAAKVRGLSEPGFRARFGTEEQCLAVLFEMRWGRGFTGERCGCRKHSRMKSRKQIQCNACKHQTGFTAGTIFHSTKLPLTTWFRAIYELTQAKGGISSIELARRLGVRQPTAWLMKQKLMSAPPGPADRVSSGDRMKGLLAFHGRARRRRAEDERQDRAPSGAVGSPQPHEGRVSGRGAQWRQARPRCGRQDAVRGRAQDDPRSEAEAPEAASRQRVPQMRDRQARPIQLRRW